MTASAGHILLVEDDTRLAALTREYLEKYGFNVDIEGRGDRAVERILNLRPDLVILDLMLPGIDGFDICRAVRNGFEGPILMLTARDGDIDQVVGLELGADDYVTKPAHPRLLLARVRALLRRSEAAPEAASGGAGSLLEFGALRIDRSAREVYLAGKRLPSTAAEFDLLWLLAERAGTIVSRDEILTRLRGLDYDGTDRSVDLRVSRLRKKLAGVPNCTVRIKTVRGQGYLFVSVDGAGD